MRRPRLEEAPVDMVEVRVPKRRKLETPNASIPVSGLADPDFARSSVPGWSPPAPITPEQDALRVVKREWRNYTANTSATHAAPGQKPLLIVDLQDFEIYRTRSHKTDGRHCELIGLDHWEAPTYNSTIKLSVDGFLCVGAVKAYVQGLPVELCSIEGYGQVESPDTVTYVQSQLAGHDPSYDIWFRVGEPSQRYKHFHEPYLAVAQFAKHTLDYLEEGPSAPVGLRNFRNDFHSWLVHRFGLNRSFQIWHKKFRDRVDFRSDVNAYRDLLYREAYNHPSSSELFAHPLWAECMAGGLTAVEKQPIISALTTTTPRVYENFKHMYFGRRLCAVPIAEKIREAQRQRKLELGFAEDCPRVPWRKPQLQLYKSSQVNVGDVIAFDPDEVDRRKWKNTEEQEWLAYVQSTETLREGVQRLFVLHMYRPSDTHIATAKYDFGNEIFFSDNCNCKEHQLLSTDVKGRYIVEWSPRTVNTVEGYFARLTYATNDSAFVTLKEEHRTCSCRAGAKSRVSAPYKPGDTVYIMKRFEQEEVLEPALIRHVNSNSTEVTVRSLVRLSRDCAHLVLPAGRTGVIPPNELVLTDDYMQVSVSKIKRHCKIRFVRERDLEHGRIPFGYDHGGAGDLWTLSMGVITKNNKSCLVYLSRIGELFDEGSDLTASPDGQPAVGLSLFGGSGGLDRGLEDGGAVRFRYVVDMDGPAIHTQCANAKDPSDQRLYYGNVNDYMRLLLSGQEHELIARVGDVHVIAAGSPCPGFSTLQQDIFSESSIKNASQITTFCSAVEIYRPKYAILENVVSMAYTRKGLEDQNVLSHLTSYLVSLGYQVSQFIMDSYNYGSAQHRSRVFVSITAPGLEPLKQPFHTHSRPWEEVVGKSLGKLPNGENFGQREWYCTPFRHVTADNIMGDLPDIGNGNVQTCLPHPDHRLSAPPNHCERSLLSCIPTDPPSCGYREAYRLGLIPQRLEKPGREHGKGYKRIDREKLVPTITTTVNCRDAHNGACVHWSQPRPLTIQEARRTQGYPDEEVIIGNCAEQYRTVGNAVDRKVSFALGLSLRDSVIKNKRQELATRTEQEVFMDIEEDLDHLSDAESDAPETVDFIPQLDGGDEHQLNRRKPRTQHPRVDTGIVNPSNQPSTMGLESAQFVSARSQVSGLEAVTRRLKSVAIEPRRPSQSPATNSSSKRKHDSNAEDHHSQELRKSGAHAEGSALGDISTPKKTKVDTSQSGNSGTAKRHTRHSDWEVGFVPQRWDKRPESLHKKPE